MADAFDANLDSKDDIETPKILRRAFEYMNVAFVFELKTLPQFYFFLCSISRAMVIFTQVIRVKMKHICFFMPEQPKPQPRVDHRMSYNQVMLSMHYHASFRTASDVESLPPHHHKEKEAENNCSVRDGNRCVVTGRSNPYIFWFIPRGRNDNADHNNATGNLEGGCIFLTGNIDLLDDIHSATELGKTHRMLNMLCTDSSIYHLLTQGLCAFNFICTHRLDDGSFQVQLKFFWMPELPGRFNQVIDLDEINRCGPRSNANGLTSFDHDKVQREGRRELTVDLDSFQHRGCPPPQFDRRSLQLASGQVIFIKISEQESQLFETVVKIHWACVTFAALCGGAGRSWYLTGRSQIDGSCQPRDEQFREDEEKKRRNIGSRF
ncbi:hypothetical protein EDB82DRAFT_471075 [Fusarium venenatum]|uniref:uncharacterized protein n=1 Tax=Fusarium venenatum TaxID=56646 RepID=UPI001DC30013|nr:hypothetical protein EDB82DRAFT_471075 [Fusarium venenatum]